jgi:UDP-N-acetylglucosamine 2-epimerase (non-hydrolysing)
LTGQHARVITPLLEHYGVVANSILPIERRSGSLPELTGAIAIGFGDFIEQERPDGIIVQGDTTSAMVAAVCGFLCRIPVFHVEAGLRSNDLQHPFPEEFNRRVVSLATTKHFVPTINSRSNLLREGIHANDIFVVGNTVIDALLWTLNSISPGPSCFENPGFKILVTCHRRESWDGGIASICEAIKIISDRIPCASILFPVHPNPNVEQTVKKSLGQKDRITLCSPLDYATFCRAMKESDLIISDSGGVQEEALALGRPTLVTRDVTERPEVLNWETVRLVGTNTDKIVREALRMHEDREHYARCSIPGFPFGEGDTAERITRHLHEFFRFTRKG